MKLKLTCVALLITLAACQTIGLAPAANMEQRIAYAFSTNAAVRNAVASSVEQGRIEKKEAVAVLEITNQARALLDGAQVANGAGDIATAEGRLSLAVSLLTALQTRLNQRTK